MQVRLKLRCGPRVELHQRQGQQLLIGCGDQADIRLSHPSVAKKHARLLVRRNSLILSPADPGGRSVIYRGRPIGTSVVLKEQERFQIGEISVAAWLNPEPEESWVGRKTAWGFVEEELESPYERVRKYLLKEGSQRRELSVANSLEEQWLAKLSIMPPWCEQAGARLEQVQLADEGLVWVERLSRGVRLSHLARALRRRILQIPIGIVVRVVVELSRQLLAYHERGVAHGCLGPQVVQLGRRGEVVLLRPGPDRALKLRTFCSLERRQGAEALAKDDAWALGALAHQLTMGCNEAPSLLQYCLDVWGQGQSLMDTKAELTALEQKHAASPRQLARWVRLLEAQSGPPLVVRRS